MDLVKLEKVMNEGLSIERINSNDDNLTMVSLRR